MLRSPARFRNYGWHAILRSPALVRYGWQATLRPPAIRARATDGSRFCARRPEILFDTSQAAGTCSAMTYDFLIESYDSERVKVLSVWSEFKDDDLSVRPRTDDPRGRSVQEQMVHQCLSEDAWFRNMLGIDVGAPPLPHQEVRLEFMKRYAEDSGKRLECLRQTDERWWEALTSFFDVQRSRAWVMTRRLTHT